MQEHSLGQRLAAETIGTALLVLVGPGSVVATLILAGDSKPAITGADLLGISFAFGLIITALVYFAWGEIYSLFPATCGDTYGKKFASANAGLLYTAKGTAALMVPFSSMIGASAGGWHTVFIGAAVLNFIAATLALVALKPLRAGMTQSLATPLSVAHVST